MDGSIHSAAVDAQAGGTPSLTIDLGKPSMFNMIAIDHGRDEHGFAARVAVYTSMDGRRFTRQYVGPGTRRVTSLLLTRAVMARYVRLDAVAPGIRPWSVAEIYMQ